MEPTVQNHKNPRKAVVLIVEDNEKNLKLFSLIVRFLGYETLNAVNGVEGVRTAKEVRPDLILMDIQMPVMDGLSAIDLLKSDEKTRSIPVIALTSFAMKGDRERFLEHGFAEYLSKPVRKEDLIKAIKNILGKGDYSGG